MEVTYFEGDQQRLSDYFKIAARRKLIILIVASSVFVVFFTTLALWRPTYQSKAIILIEEQDIPPDFVATTVTSYAVQRMEEIKQRIMTNSNIIDIVDRFELLSAVERQRLTRSEIASDFREKVAIEPISADVIDPRSGRPTQATIAFSVSFKGDSIGSVHKVANELVTLLLNANLKERTQQSESTAQFMNSEATALDIALREYEQKISNFKEMHKGSLPELNSFNMNVVDRGQQELLSVQTRIMDLENRKISLAAQLTQLVRSAPTVLANGKAMLGPADRLSALRAEYSYKRTIYTSDHPELQRIKREMEALTNDTQGDSKAAIAKELAEIREKLKGMSQQYNSTHPSLVALQRQEQELTRAYANALDFADDIPPDNPSYILVASQIDGLNSEIASLRDKTEQLQQRIEDHEQLLLKSPTVEKEYQALLRDYDNARLKYREIKAKGMAADLAKNLEQERKGERFTLIQPPEIPEKAISPNIKLMSALGIILSLGLGLGSGLLADNFDRRVFGEKRIKQITFIEPLVTIPYMSSLAEVQKSNLQLKIALFAAAAITVLFLIVFHLLVKPLDVTWFILLRKLGLN